MTSERMGTASGLTARARSLFTAVSWGTFIALACFALVLGACGGSVETAADVMPKAPGKTPGGNLVLVGGGRKPDAVVRLFVELAGGARARIVVLPLASGDSREAGGDYIELFEKFGAGSVDVIHIDDRRDAVRADFADRIRNATGVFFSGGDQSRIASRMVGTPVLEALRAMKAAGGVVGGTSAGTACQSEVMLVGDGDETVIRAGNIVTSRGIGLFEGVIVDSHFVARRRNNRLVSAVLEHPELVGVGIDEATAAWVKPDGTMEVVGDGWVLVYDATEAEVTRKPDGRMSVANMHEHALIAGQKYDLRSKKVIP